MGTPFSNEDDKQLVQLAREYADRGQRISWREITHRMRRTGHTQRRLSERLRALKHTYGNDLTAFPPAFFTPIRCPRGRPPARARPNLLPASHTVANVHSSAIAAPSVQVTSPPVQAAPLPVPAPTLLVPVAALIPTLEEAPSIAPAGPAPPSSPTEQLSLDPREVEAVRDFPTPSYARTPPGPVSQIERAIARVFESIPRAAVVYDPRFPFQNSGEILPTGVTAMLNSFRDYTERDVFLDVGAGIGNVVLQVAVQTPMCRVIGIEQRVAVCEAGRQAILNSGFAWMLNDKLELITGDIRTRSLSSLSVVATPSIIFTNNIRFDPSTNEYLKQELTDMVDIRWLASTQQFCPRHRSPCAQPFCSSFSLVRQVHVPVSWTGTLQPVFIYRDNQGNMP